MFIALDASDKAIVTQVSGKRKEATTRVFVNDVWEWIVNRLNITGNGFGPILATMAECFGDDADYAQLVKHYAAEKSVQAARQYSPPHEVRVERPVVSGAPKRRRHSTSHVERQI